MRGSGLLASALLALAEAAAVRPWRAVVVGGNGRVGGSTVRWLLKLADEHGRPLHVAVGGRSARNFDALRGRLGGAAEAADGTPRLSFVACDLDDDASLDAALAGADVCVHTAGPFQSVERPACLAAAVRQPVGKRAVVRLARRPAQPARPRAQPRAPRALVPLPVELEHALAVVRHPLRPRALAPLAARQREKNTHCCWYSYYYTITIFIFYIYTKY